ncbi:TetR/AcrR family transcriptional regulator [Actinomycetospora rhizophila]|uniref:TetR/AcrR family transcriptional regulator n=1 Tax=Actinomycetospora rhizophila TaxID=1416876 RepID=A0ABV9ZHF8_9PSEU
MTSFVLPPEPHGRRDRRVQELLFDIKDAALDQLADGRASGVSYRAIAARLGVSRATLRYHFPSRDDLVDALVADGFITLERSLRAALDRVRDAPLAQRWTTLAHAYRRWALRHPRHYGVLQHVRAGTGPDRVERVFVEIAPDRPGRDGVAATVHARLRCAVLRELDARARGEVGDHDERFDGEVRELARVLDGDAPPPHAG